MIVYEDFDDSAMIPMAEHRRLVAEAVAAERKRCVVLANQIYDLVDATTTYPGDLQQMANAVVEIEHPIRNPA